jgi:hypothetical protein
LKTKNFILLWKKIGTLNLDFDQDPEYDPDPEPHLSKGLYPDLDPLLMNADQKHLHPHSALVLLQKSI